MDKEGTPISQNQTPQLPSLLHLEKFYTLGLMTNRIAHQINNSIQGMLLVVSFLESDYSSDENIAALSREVHNTKKIIQSIQSFVKENNLEFESINLSALIRETLTLIRDITADPIFDGIGVQYPPSSLLPIKGNFFYLQLALLNLLLSIGQSADRLNPPQIKIQVLTDPSSHTHTIRIYCFGQSALDKLDKGEDFSEYSEHAEHVENSEHAQHSEKSGYREHAGEARFSLVQRVLNMHQGTFQALDEHDGGLCFIITLPISGCQE